MSEFLHHVSEDFEAFYLRHYKTIYRVCYTFMKKSHDAEDCTEDVFVRALTCGIDFENERHERAWLTTTAMNLCKDRLKYWWRQKVSSIDDEFDIAADEPEDHREVLEAVMELPVKYKEVIWLHYYEGYQTDEIAKMLKRPGSTVRNQLRDARNKLKEKLGGEFGE